MPQFDQISEIWASQLFWLAIFFGAMFFIVGRGMLPRIVSTVDARNEKIENDLKVAESVKNDAEVLEETYREELNKGRSEAMQLTSAAKTKAAKATEAAIAKADSAIATKIEKATAKIAESRAAAQGEIETIAAEAATAMVERVSAMKVAPAEARTLVKQELANG